MVTIIKYMQARTNLSKEYGGKTMMHEDENDIVRLYS